MAACFGAFVAFAVGLLDVFFILSPLRAGGRAGADEPDFVGWALDVTDDEEPAALGPAEEEETLLHARMIGVGHRDRQGVAEGGRCLREADAVLAEVGGSLARVPGETEGHARKLTDRDARACPNARVQLQGAFPIQARDAEMHNT